MARLLLSAVVIGLLVWPVPVAGQAPNVATHETTITATVDRIERSSRVVNFRSEGNTFQTVYIDPKIKEFDDLRVGDVVTVRFVESVIVQVNPKAKPSVPKDTTAEAQKAGGDQVIAQTTAVVTIENIDPQGLFVTYRTEDGMKVVRAVLNKALLKGVRVGDRVEVTATQQRAVEIQRKKP